MMENLKKFSKMYDKRFLGENSLPSGWQVRNWSRISGMVRYTLKQSGKSRGFYILQDSQVNMGYSVE
jgi:hypothetical protein